MGKKKKGSMTLEAVIAASVFIMFSFMLLTVIKMVLFMTILDNATTETAKTICVFSYPISMLNEKQASIEKYGDFKLEDGLSTVNSASLSVMLGGDPKTVLKGGAESIIKNLIGKTAVDLLSNKVYEIKGQAVEWIVSTVLNGCLENTGINFDKSKMVIRMAKIPQTKAEYEAVYPEPLLLSEDGNKAIVPSSSEDGLDGDFNAEDVLICVEYPFEIKLPLLPTVTIKLRSTTVEHGWLHGTVTGPKREEGIDLENLIFGNSKTVYIPTGGHGRKYHKPTCQSLWSSSQKVTLAYAKNLGFEPCKICRPDDKD